MATDKPVIPETMRTVRLNPPGRMADLKVEDLVTPVPTGGDVLVRVHAAAITRDELNWSAGRLPATPSYELSGTVAALGADVGSWEVGQDVFAMTDFDRDGAASQYALVAADRLSPKPRALSHVEAAAVPLPALSAIQGLFEHGRLTPKERVLIHGGAGGVGTYAVQLAQLHGAFVIATASGERVSRAAGLGADRVIDYTTTDFTEAGSVDLVFDTVGGDRLRQSLEVLEPGGRLVSVAEEPPVEEAKTKGIDACWFLVQSNEQQLAELAELADQGHLRVPVQQTYPLEQAADAFDQLMHAGGIGKLVLEVESHG